MAYRPNLNASSAWFYPPLNFDVNGGKVTDFGKRSTDHGKEDPMVTLARIDENIKFLKVGAETTRIQLHEHQKDDSEKFTEIGKKLWEHARYIYMGLGIVGVVEVIIGFHK